MKRSYQPKVTHGIDLSAETLVFDSDQTMRRILDFDETPCKVRKSNNSIEFKGPRQLSLAAPLTSPLSSPIIREAKLKDAEILSLKAHLSQLESQIAAEKGLAHEEQINHDRELQRIKSEREREKIRYGEQETKLTYLLECQKTAKEAGATAEANADRKTQDLERRLAQAQKEKREAQDRTTQQSEQWQETEKNLHYEIYQLKQEIITLQSSVRESRAQLELREARDAGQELQLVEVDQLRQQLRQQNDKVKSLEGQLASQVEAAAVTRALKADLDAVPQMKAELEKLRLDNEQLRYNEQNCHLLEERVHGLQAAAARHEGDAQELARLQEDYQELQGRLSRWEAQDQSGSRRPQSPTWLNQRLQEAEAKQAALQLQADTLTNSLQHVEALLAASQQECQTLTSQLEAERGTATSQADRLRRQTRKLTLITRERDSFKELLTSYEDELTMDMAAQRQAQTQRQEAIMADYRAEMANLEAELSRLQQIQPAKLAPAAPSPQSPNPAALAKATRQAQDLREKNAELEIRLADTVREKDILEARLEKKHLQGDYDPSKTKVLHFTMNPVAIAEKKRETQVAELIKEVESLRKRNQILEESGGAVNDLTIQVNDRLAGPDPEKELLAVKEELKRSETRAQRLKECFKKFSNELREVCFILTGYRIDIPTSQQYRLSSIYAQSSKDFLLFQQKDGEIQMLATDWSASLGPQLESLQAGGFPVFLSQLTLDLARNATFS